MFSNRPRRHSNGLRTFVLLLLLFAIGVIGTEIQRRYPTLHGDVSQQSIGAR